MKRRILVTGGWGMVGRSLRQVLKNEKVFFPTRQEVDFLNKEDVERAFSVYKPTHVIHLAARVGGLKDNMENQAEFFEQNVQMALNVLGTAAKFDCEKTVSLLSSCIYPDKIEYPIEAEKLHDGPPHPSNFGYAYAKRMIDVYGRALNQKLGKTAFVTLVPNNLYGKCFSSDTEVMTPRGIVNVADVSIGDSVYTLNPKTHEIEIAKVTATTETWSNEQYNFVGKGVDFIVTPEHKMYFKTSGEFLKKPAHTFKNKCGKKFGQITLAHHSPLLGSPTELFSLKKWIDENHIQTGNTVRDHKSSSSKSFPIVYNLEDFAEFVGWYISEGSMVTNFTKGGKQSTKNVETGQISLHQDFKANPTNHLRIRNLLTNMNIPHGWDDKRIYFTSRLFRNFLKSEVGVGSLHKTIPSFLLREETSHMARRRLFDALMSGDGNKTGNRYTTTSSKLANDFQHLSFLLAEKTSGVSFDNAHRIALRPKNKNTTVKYKNITNSVSNIQQKYYCFTTSKNNIVYAGRNKKFNWIGQCDNFDLETSHFIPALIRKFADFKENGAPIVMWGTGDPEREFTFADDVAKIIIKALKFHNSEEPLNIGNPKNYRIKDVVEMMASIAEVDPSLIQWDLMKPDGQQKKPTKVDLTFLHWDQEDFTPLKQGLTETWNWFLNERKERIRGMK